jgi:hypothetical protein
VFDFDVRVVFVEAVAPPVGKTRTNIVRSHQANSASYLLGGLVFWKLRDSIGEYFRVVGRLYNRYPLACDGQANVFPFRALLRWRVRRHDARHEQYAQREPGYAVLNAALMKAAFCA